MNSYQTLNAAARIAGIAVRHAVAWGQAYEGTGRTIASRRLHHAIVGNLPRAEVGRWNAEDKARQLKQKTVQVFGQGFPPDMLAAEKAAVIPRRDYADKAPGRYQVVYQESALTSLPWKVYDTKYNPSMRGDHARRSFRTAVQATEFAIQQEDQA